MMVIGRERVSRGAGVEFEARVVDVREECRVAGSARWQLLLEGGGISGETRALEAMSRNGTRLRLAVLGVERDRLGQLWYVVEKPLATGTVVRVFPSTWVEG